MDFCISSYYYKSPYLQNNLIDHHYHSFWYNHPIPIKTLSEQYPIPYLSISLYVNPLLCKNINACCCLMVVSPSHNGINSSGNFKVYSFSSSLHNVYHQLLISDFPDNVYVKFPPLSFK